MLTAENVGGQEADMLEVHGSGRGMSLNLGERSAATIAAKRLIESFDYLANLNHDLEQSDVPAPAIGVNLSTVRGTDLPRVFISYGRTLAGEGLRSMADIDLHGEFGRKVKYGLALPMDRKTQGSVTFFPHEYDEEGKPQGSLTTGWWQQWRPDRSAVFKPGEEPHIVDYPDSDISFNDYYFSTWRVPLNLPPMPHIIDGGDFAQEEASRCLKVVRDIPEPWKAVYNGDNQNLTQHFTAVGHEAVSAAMTVLEEQPAGTSDTPSQLTDMLRIVSEDLEIRV